MKRKEFDLLSKGSIVYDRKTKKNYEVLKKEGDYILTKDGISIPYKDCILQKEKFRKFDSIYGYDYLRQRWIYDCKLYLKDGKWFLLSSDEYMKDIDNSEKKDIDNLMLLK